MKRLTIFLLLFGCSAWAADAVAQSGKTAGAPPAAAQPAGAQKPLAVGELAPDFTLPDQDGKQVTLSAVRGKTPVVLVFYRGYW